MSLPYKELSEAGLDALIESERKRVVAPLTEWRTLSMALKEEGLIRTPMSETFEQSFDQSPRPRRRVGMFTWGVRAFASIALFGSGLLIGRTVTLGESIVPLIKEAIVADSARSAQLVTHDFQSSEEAIQVLNRAQSEYEQAAAYLSAYNNGGMPPMDMASLRERLAALDMMVAAAQSAMRESPGDPLLTQYYMSSAGARNATLQLLNQTLPEGAQLAGY
jgi:hypothetical protein